MQTKNIPVILMLIAGAITSVITYYFHYDLKSMLTILLVVLLLFYFLGVIIKLIIDKFLKIQKVEEISEEGEVIQKENENLTEE